MPELLSDDGSALEQRALSGLEPVETRGQQCLNGRRYSNIAVALTKHREHLLDEEWIASGRRRDPLSHGLLEVCAFEQVLDELVGFVVGQGLEPKRRRVRLAATPAWPVIQKLGTGKSEQEDRGVAAEDGNVLDEVEEGRFGPLKVVENDGQRSLARERLEELSHSAVRLFRAARALQQPESREDVVDDLAGIRLSRSSRRTISISLPSSRRISTSGQ